MSKKGFKGNSVIVRSVLDHAFSLKKDKSWIAEKIGRSRSTVYNYIELCDMPARDLERLVDALGLDLIVATKI